jgi:hypothetical protein
MFDVFPETPPETERLLLEKLRAVPAWRKLDLVAQLNQTAPAEDTILAKLEWYRLGGEVSERQWRDVQEMLKAQSGRLDLAYMNQWATDLKVDDLLDSALTESARSANR